VETGEETGDLSPSTSQEGNVDRLKSLAEEWKCNWRGVIAGADARTYCIFGRYLINWNIGYSDYGFHNFAQSLQANAELLSSNRQRLLPSKLCPPHIHDELHILFEAHEQRS
jgi:hypothetical protein